MIGAWISKPLGILEGDADLYVIGQVEVGLPMSGPSTQSSVKREEKIKCNSKALYIRWYVSISVAPTKSIFRVIFLYQEILVGGVYLRPRPLTRV